MNNHSDFSNAQQEQRDAIAAVRCCRSIDYHLLSRHVMSHAGQSGADFFSLRCISLGWTLSVLPWQQKIDAKNWNR